VCIHNKGGCFSLFLSFFLSLGCGSRVLPERRTRGFYRFASPSPRRCRRRSRELVTSSENCYPSLSNRYARRRETTLGPVFALHLGDTLAILRIARPEFQMQPAMPMQFRNEIKAQDSRSRVETFVQKSARKHCKTSAKEDGLTEKLNDYLCKIMRFLALKCELVTKLYWASNIIEKGNDNDRVDSRG